MASDSFLLNQLRSAYTRAGNRIYMGVPEGTIIAWSGGYFTDGINGGFTSVLGNTAAAVNALFNEFGFYVCDGATINIAKSQIFNGSGRYLANLTDSRFLMGSTAVGSSGGSSTMAHTHGVTSNVAVGNHTALSVSNHSVTQPAFNGPDHSHNVAGTTAVNYGGAGRGPGAQIVASDGHVHNFNAYSGYGGTGACTITQNVAVDAHSFSQNISDHSVTNNAVTSGAASNDANLPKYLTCFYLTKVF